MIYFLLFFYCSIICILKFFKTRIWSPPFLFAITWLIICSFYALGSYMFYDVSDNTFLVIFIGSCSFLLGGLLSKIIDFKEFITYNHKMDNSLQLPLLLIIGIISILEMFNGAIHSVKLLLSGLTYEQIITTSGVTNINTFKQLIEVYIAFPFCYAIVPIWASEMLSNKTKANNKILITIIAVFCIVLRILQHGGRFFLLLSIYYFVFIAIINERHFEFKKNKKILLFIIVMSMFFFILLSKSRGINNLWNSLYIYVCGCIPHLNYRLSLVNSNKYYTYGLASLYGFYAGLMFILRGVGLVSGHFFYYVSSAINMENIVTIGNNITFNAFVTLFFFPYLDFRYLGVIVILFLYGYIVFQSYKKVYKYKDNKYIVVFSALSMGILSSGIRLQFSTYAYALSFIYFYILYKKNNQENDHG